MNEPTPKTSNAHLPWPFNAAALVAFAALHFTGKYDHVLPVLAVLLVATYFTRLRLSRSKILGWSLRIVIWTVLITFAPARHRDGYNILLEPDYVQLFGYMCAAEFVLRAWIRDTPVPSRGEALLLTALIFTAAGTTYDRAYIKWFAPAYAVLLILCLRNLAHDVAAQPARRMPMNAMRAIVLILALSLGGGGVFAVTHYEARLISWSSKFLRAKRTTPAEIGLSATPQLQRTFNPHASMERVLRISGTRNEMHIRAAAYDLYDARQWKPFLRDRGFRRVDPSALQTSIEGSPLQMTRFSEVFGLILAPLNVASISAPEHEMERDELGTFRLSEPVSKAHYQIVVPRNESSQGPMCVAMDERARQRSLQMPEALRAQIEPMARRAAGEGEMLSRVLRIAQHLRSNHSYSLEYDPGSGEPIADFLLNNRNAHCQYFASGLVMMSRAIGVPARYVTGYFAHEHDGDGLVVREQDAHAWAECWIDGIGWITLDATPATGRPSVLFPPPSRGRKFWEWIKDLPDTVRALAARWDQRMSLITAGAVAIVAAPFVIVRILRWRRRSATVPSARSYPLPSAELREIAQRFERWLALRGQPIVNNRTWREQLAREPSENSRRFIDEYDSARFGAARDGAARDAIARLRQLLDSLGT